MRITIRHEMSITPPAETARSVMHLLLTPASGPTQTIESWHVDAPGIDNAAQFSDAYGNSVHLVNQNNPEGAQVVTVSGVVVTKDLSGVVGRPGGEPVPALYKRITALTKASVTLYGKFRGSKETRIDVLHALMARVGEKLGLDGDGTQTQTSGTSTQSQSQSQTSDDEVPATATELVHMFIGGARALDIPARFVTGYVAAEPDGDDDLIGYHVWAEAYDEALGWIGFDPLLQICPSDRHVRLAVGLDAVSAAPLRASPAGDGVEMISVSVESEA